MIFLQLFWSFFKIGLFGFGGGYAMISLIQGEVVTKYHWISTSEFTDIVAVSQMTPGPIGINSATFVGYRAIVNAGYPVWMGMAGSALATFAQVLPSFLLMILVLKVLQKYWNHPATRDILSGLRPTVVGLIAAAALLLMTPDNFGSPVTSPWQFGISIFLFAAAFIGTQTFRINPIRMICFCGLAGLFLYY